MYDLKILLCDDSMLIRKKLKGALAELGFTNLFEAIDGEEAVTFCRTEQPDLVLMDIVMPKKDGIEALQEIKIINPAIHVVMASSVGTQSNLIKALKLGADNFLQKPIQVDIIVDIAKKIVEDRGVQ
ncbi:response regulator [Paenibacillus sp. FSL H7-0331]|uniref:response regulator n=1 Tax=Paenibacillus sp. FSL H7-0331 TaxID=1920421 RepID=UPI00096C8613|nr:response regulator [Paenibacillus sp. FSL H7-0331]OMF18173.1 two-component system response regulator [Paenibacillus sp. FSL H7-0331]